MSLRLYELPAAYRALAERAEDGEDVSELIEQLDDQLNVRATHLVTVLRGLEAEASVIRDEEERLANRRRALEVNASRLRVSVRTAMLEGRVERIVSPTFSLALRQGPPKVLSVDEDKLPAEYWRVKREPDKRAILRAYEESGEIVDGCEVGSEPYLVIR